MSVRFCFDNFCKRQELMGPHKIPFPVLLWLSPLSWKISEKRSPRRAQQPATCHPRRNEFSDINIVTHCTLQTLTQLDVGHVCPKNKHELSHMWARSGGTIIAGSRRVIHCRIRQDYIMAQAAERKGRQPRRTNTSSTPQGPQKILYLVPNSKLLRRVLAADFNGIRTGSG